VPNGALGREEACGGRTWPQVAGEHRPLLPGGGPWDIENTENGMTAINGSILIRRPIEQVFDFVADERNEPVYNPKMRSVEKTTPGPIGIGTLWHVVMESGKRSSPLELEVTEYARLRRLGSRTRMTSVPG
jgi:hypothetical protein